MLELAVLGHAEVAAMEAVIDLAERRGLLQVNVDDVVDRRGARRSAR
jgi:hypothetical protein